MGMSLMGIIGHNRYGVYSIMGMEYDEHEA